MLRHPPPAAPMAGMAMPGPPGHGLCQRKVSRDSALGQGPQSHQWYLPRYPPPSSHTHPWRWTWSTPSTARSAALVLSAGALSCLAVPRPVFPLVGACPALQQRKGLSEGQPPPLKGQAPAPPRRLPLHPLAASSRVPGSCVGRAAPQPRSGLLGEKAFAKEREQLGGRGSIHGGSPCW